MAARRTSLGRRLKRKRVRTPTVLQMEAVECGAAALASVLAHYGRIVPLEELRLACGVSRDGSKASNVIRAATDYGLEAHGYSKEIDELRSMTLPCIVFWNFNHFVVVEGFGKDVVYLNDPASGPRQVSDAEFDHSFTGVVITLTPTPTFEKRGHKPSLLRTLRPRLHGSGSALAYVILAGLALMGTGLVIPTFSRVFVDEFLIGGNRRWMVPLLLGMGLTLLLRAALMALQKHTLMRLQARLAISGSSHFLWHILRLPVGFFTQRYGGEIGSRVALNDWVAHLLSGQLASTAVNVLTAAFYLILLLQYSVALTLAGIAVAVLNMVALRLFARLRVDANRRLQLDQGKLMGTSMNGLQLVETLKATGREGDFFVRWSGYLSKVVNTQQKLGVYDESLNAVSMVLSAILSTVILGLGGLRVMEGGPDAWTIGMLVAYQSLMASFLGPFNSLVDLGATLQNAEGAMNRVDDVLNHRRDPHWEAESASESAGVPTRKLSGHLQLKNITFGYSRRDPPLIEDFHLTLKPGQRVALVGGSGCGKSTLAKLVCGLYEPWSGEILLDGRPRGAYSRHVLTTSMALVDQEICLFEDTVSENLTLWDETIPEEQIVQAAKDACIHEDIAIRAGGYDGAVAEAGGNYSGGQRQRLEIARALVGNPTLLVLDEATSALDSVTEARINDNLRRRGCAYLIVAHRLSTIRHCDEIIVLERGRVVQRGTHEELHAVEGPYAELIKAE